MNNEELTQAARAAIAAGDTRQTFICRYPLHLWNDAGKAYEAAEIAAIDAETLANARSLPPLKMTHQEALDKAAKLLRLAGSNNAHEAALAASRAQEIIDRYKLTLDAVNGAGGEIRTEEPIANFNQDPLDPAPRLDRWRGQLAMSLCKANQCQCYVGHGRANYGNGLCLIGRASDVQTIRYLYAWLTREIERLAARDCAGCGRSYWNNFRLGAVETLSRRLKETQAATIQAVKMEALESGGNRALILIEQSALAIQQRAEAVKQWQKTNLKLRARSSSRTQFNSSAREAGRRAGAEIRMGQRAALNSTRSALQ